MIEIVILTVLLMKQALIGIQNDFTDMKDYVFTLICALMTLTAAAGDLPVSREQLRSSVLNGSGMRKLPAPEGHKLSASLQDRHVNLQDNQLNARAPHRTSISELEGDRIVMVDSYDFDWDNENGTAAVIDSTYFMMGKISKLTLEGVLSQQYGDLYIENFYSVFTIPINVDPGSNVVKIKAGTLLSSYTYQSIDGFLDLDQWSIFVRGDSEEVRYNVYAMPETWLSGDDEYDDIYGQILPDGSIEFFGGFAFLIKMTEVKNDYDDEVSWGLSPIFRHLKLLAPNGVHEYESTLKHTGEQNMIPESQFPGVPMGGGLVPRPVTPRPINPKPITPRPFITNVAYGYAGNAGNSAGDLRDSLAKKASLLQRPGYQNFTTPCFEPVYIYQANDTSILVFNLYGSDYSWNYMILRNDSTMSFPGQAVERDGDSKFYNYSSCGDSLKLGNEGTWDADTIRWGTTYFFDGTKLQKYNCSNNKIYYSASISDFVPNPVFEQPVVTDSTVTFSATTDVMDSFVYLLIYDPECDDYFVVDNPFTVDRTDSDFAVSLAAITEVYTVDEDGENYLYSDYVFWDYVVPAQGIGPGDVDHSGCIDIDDVTILINAVLGNSPEVYYPENADCNVDGDIDIDDVTILITHVLTGSWPLPE